jgi:hypothetical protein
MGQMALFVKRQANVPKLNYRKGEVGRKGRGMPTVHINKGGGKEIREKRRLVRKCLRLSVEYLRGITTGSIITIGNISTRYPMRVTAGAWGRTRCLIQGVGFQRQIVSQWRGPTTWVWSVYCRKRWTALSFASGAMTMQRSSSPSESAWTQEVVLLLGPRDNRWRRNVVT